MDINRLTRIFEGSATEEDLDKILEWLNESEENKAAFAREKELWLLSSFKNEDAPREILESINEKITPTLAPQKQKVHSGFFRTAFWISSAAVVALLITLFGVNNSHSTEIAGYEERLASALLINLPVGEQNDTVIMNTVKGVKSSFELPDGSKVTLNSDSRLIYPKKFSGESRNVHLVGEAHFDVVHNEHYPMIVTTDKNFSVKVLGTKFSVKSFPNDNYATTSLYSGLVKMVYKNTEIELAPNQSCMISDNDDIIKIIKEKKIEDDIAWTKGVLLFENAPMSEVIKMLERWHGTKFIINNERVLNYSITARFKEESITQIMDMLNYILSINYTIDNNVVTIK